MNWEIIYYIMIHASAFDKVDSPALSKSIGESAIAGGWLNKATAGSLAIGVGLLWHKALMIQLSHFKIFTLISQQYWKTLQRALRTMVQKVLLIEREQLMQFPG